MQFYYKILKQLIHPEYSKLKFPQSSTELDASFVKIPRKYESAIHLAYNFY